MTWEGIANDVSLTGLGAVLAFLAKAQWERRKHRDERSEKRGEREDRLAQHRDDLALKLLEAANAQAASMRLEMQAMRLDMDQMRVQLSRFDQLEQRLQLQEEATLHVRQLLDARVSGDWDAARHSAELFLARVKLFDEAHGAAVNAIQRDRSGKSLGIVHGPN